MWPDNKPSPRIYQHALRRAVGAGGLLGDEAWVHVGDCLLNDAAASKRAGAATVWLDAPADPLASFSTASADEQARRQAARAEALADGAVDARIESMDALPGALQQLLRLDAGAARAARAA